MNTAVVFSAANGNLISTGDIDAGSNPLEVTLTAADGTLTLNGTSGLNFSLGDGSADPTMTFTGTAADINTALDGLRYDPPPGYSGSTTLAFTTNDQGYVGAGGPQSDVSAVIINVAFTNTAPTLSGANDLATIDEDPVANPGTLVSDLITDILD